MSRTRGEESWEGPACPAPDEPTPDAPSSRVPPPESGVVRKEDLDAELCSSDTGGDAGGAAPPWPVVLSYLTSGDHRAWVEAHAARSRAFADVLAALDNDAEERPAGRGRVIRLRR